MNEIAVNEVPMNFAVSAPHDPASPRLLAPLYDRFLRKLVAGARGRAFLLGFMADAEESDEAGVFDNLLARVDDPSLARLVRRHRDDEQRHARLFQGCVARTGIVPDPIPTELRYVDLLDRALGGFAASFAADAVSVMEAYLLLQVIEERGVQRFRQIARALRPFDPESADVVEEVIRDEERHVRYARAISKRYAPSPESLERTLRRYREVEARVFVDHGAVLLRHVTTHDLLEASPLERWFWRAVA